MPKVKNESGEDRIVFGRLVMKGAVLEVAADQVYGLTCQSIWSPSDEAAKKAHTAGKKAEQERVSGIPAEAPKKNDDPKSEED